MMSPVKIPPNKSPIYPSFIAKRVLIIEDNIMVTPGVIS